MYLKQAVVLASALSLWPAANSTAQTQIGTPLPVRQIGMFSNTMHTTMGQSVTTPLAVNSLDSFTFWLNAHHSTILYDPALTFRAYVMAWDALAEHTVGPVLYESGFFVGPTSPMQRYDFQTGGVSVTSGSTYLVFLSLLGGPTMNSATQFGVLMGYGYDEYAAGRWYATNIGSDPTSLGRSGWTHDTAIECQACDAAFKVEYSSVAVVTPEPSTLGLTLSGLLMVVALHRRRRHSRHILSERLD